MTSQATDASDRMPARIGYTKGVPMGGDLPAAPDGKAPTFLVCRPQGPDRGEPRPHPGHQGLARREGQRAGEGVRRGLGRREKRQPGTDGKLPSVGSTVDVPNATWSNTIGDSELSSVWKDPDFDPALKAFYYARVIEIPTPRWTAYDAKRFGVKPTPEALLTVTERAYTSAIWYTPVK
jgi:hypothetical protein